MARVDVLTKFLNIAELEGPKAAVEKFDEGLNKLGSTLRWVGRDYMRLGSTVGKVSTFFGKYWKGLVAGSDSLSSAFEDIGWAGEDVSNVIGDQMAPAFEGIGNTLENIADFLDAHPFLAQLAGWGLLILTIFPRMIGIFGQFTGWFATLAGNIMMSRQQSMNLIDTMKVVIKGLFGIRAEAGKVQATQIMLARRQKDGTYVMYKLDSVAENVSQGFANYSYTLSTTTQGTEEATKSTEKQEKATGDLSKKGKKASATLMGIGLAGAAVTGVLGILSLVMSQDSDLWDSFSNILANVQQFFEPIFDLLADWIDEHPEQAMALLLGVLGGFVGVKLIDTFSGIANIPKDLENISGAFSRLKGWLLGTTIDGKTTVGVLSKIKGGFSSIGERITGFLSKEGSRFIGFLNTDLSTALSTTGGKLKVFGGILMAAVMGFEVGYNAAKALITAIGPMGAVAVSVAGCLIILAAAVWALQNAWTVGTAMAMMFGSMIAVGAFVAYMESLKPAVAMQAGGIVKAPTIALLGEKGPERVTPLKRGGGGMTTEPPMYVTFQVSGGQDPKTFAREAYAELEKLRRERMKNQVY